MRNNQRLPWLIGLGMLAVSLAGWLMPKRRKTTAGRMMDWSQSSMRWFRDSTARGPVPRMLMRSGRRIIRGMLR